MSEPNPEIEPRRFAIAVSFPGEHRRFVRNVVNRLAEVLGRERVFYDEWYESELLGLDGDLKLRRYYREQSEMVVPFFSEHYRKPWCEIEWHAIRAMLKSRKAEDAVIPVQLDGTRIEGWEDIDFGIRRKSRSGREIADLILAAYRHRHPEDPSASPTAEDAPHKSAAARTRSRLIAMSRLLELGVTTRFEKLVGREAERRILSDAWNNDDPHVLIFVAEGGVGKTSLVADWLMDFVNAHWEGVDAFFDWSFYSQGTRDQTAAHSGQFFDAALRHFGEAELAESPGPADVKADRLADRVAAGRTLLVLDGVEPLQHPPQRGGLEGRFKDMGLERLLKRLAQLPTAGGLCVVTTRAPVVDLNRFHGRTVREETLDRLSAEAAAQVLHQAGARRAGEAEIGPDDEELLAAARELGGHALAAQLLGGYLRHAHGGDIRRRDRVDWTRAFDQQHEGHAWSVMQAYERWFEQHGHQGRRQLAALRLLGFFDRPATAASLEALRAGPVIPSLTEPLAGLDEEDWSTTLTQLADEHRLISLLRSGGQVRQVDAHPLVREYFARQLRNEHQAVWTEGHRQLYKHLCETTERRPDGLEGLEPLYQAVAHGCEAGLQQQACDDVYCDRILRGTGSGGFYSTRKLGAVGADLGAVACFFDRPWSRLSANVSAPAQAWLLNEAAFSLRALGRLVEAVEPMRASLDMDVERQEWEGAAISASNLSELELTLGEVSAAVADAEQSVAFADRSGDWGQKMIKRTTHADALHQAGRRDEARRLFAEAETLQTERQPSYPRLYSLRGFLYCDLLLSAAERAAWREFVVPPSGGTTNSLNACREVAGRAGSELERRRNLPTASILDIALTHLTLARAALYEAILAHSPLDTRHPSLINAVEALRKAGEMTYLPRGLLTRAWQRHLSGQASAAAADLDEAWEIAERGPMPLYQADVLLTRARLFALPIADCRLPLAGPAYPWGSPQDDLREARRLIEKHGYHRRDEELADAEAALELLMDQRR